MTILSHLIASDVRRWKTAIALWVTVALVQAALHHVGSFLDPLTAEARTVQLAGSLTWFAGLLLSSALVAGVIQLHPAVGSEAFWMTRPVPPGTLAAAKLALLAVVFVAVPLLVEQVLMAINRIPPADMLRVGIQTGVWRGVALVLLATAAVLTPNFARFALFIGAALFAFAMLPLILMALEMLNGEGPGLTASMLPGTGAVVPFPGSDHTSAIVGMALLLVGGATLVAIQYHGRRVPHTVIAAIGVFVSAMVAADRWTWAVVQARVTAPEWAESAPALHLTADAGAVRFDPRGAWHSDPLRWVAILPLRLTRAPAGWLATARLQHAELQLGTELRTSLLYSGPAALRDLDGEEHGQLALRDVLGVQRVSGGRPNVSVDEDSGVMLQLPREEVTKGGAVTGAFRGEFLIDVARLEEAAVLPLAPGAGYQDGAYTLTIHQMRPINNGALLSGRAAGVTAMLDRRPRPAYSYFLRNWGRSEAIEGSPHHGAASIGLAVGSGFHLYGGVWSGFWAGARAISFHPRHIDREPEFTIDHEWLTQSELVIVRATYEGTVRRTLEVPEFPLMPAKSGGNSAHGRQP